MKKKYWIPVIVIVLFCVEGIVPNYIPSYFFGNYWVIIPRFLFIFLLFVTIYYDQKLGITYAFVFGLIMDTVFTEIYGIYLFAYPVIVFGTSWLVKNWNTNLFTMFFYSGFAVAALEFVLYGLYLMINIADITFGYFITHRLMPTVIINAIFYIIVCFPLKKYFAVIKKVKEEEEGMFQS